MYSYVCAVCKSNPNKLHCTPKNLLSYSNTMDQSPPIQLNSTNSQLPLDDEHQQNEQITLVRCSNLFTIIIINLTNFYSNFKFRTSKLNLTLIRISCLKLILVTATSCFVDVRERRWFQEEEMGRES